MLIYFANALCQQRENKNIKYSNLTETKIMLLTADPFHRN